MTYDTKGIWRCYEVKVSVSDFRSKANNTFCGHFNYYVMTSELYEKVKAEIPSHIGVYIGGTSMKRAKRQELLVDEEILKKSLIRSLCREADKTYKNNNPSFVDNTRRKIARLEKELELARRNYSEFRNQVREKFGRQDWN